VKTEIPEFIHEMAKRLNEQDSRCTSHPFFQTRCKRYVVTEQGYNDHHYEICGDDGVLFRSHVDELEDFISSEEYSEYWEKVITNEELSDLSEISLDVEDFIFEEFLDGYDLNLIYVQEVDEIVSTHMTEADANRFIARKQHDYPKLYTYAASAYFSQDLRQLQDWIKTLENTDDKGEG
jgi:hypothetical protein